MSTDQKANDTSVASYRPVDGDAAAALVAGMAALSEHPEIIALHAAQEAAGTSDTPEGCAEMRALYERLYAKL